MVQEILNVNNLVGCYKGTFGKVYAVDHVSLKVNRGEIVGIAGESGSGKSTLAELISGMPRPLLHFESGLVEVKGYDIYRIDQNTLRSEVLSQIIGYAPQASMNSLNPVLKVKRFLLDVMKQRTAQQLGIGRKIRLSNSILLEGIKNKDAIGIKDAEIHNFIELFLRYSKIAKNPTYEFLLFLTKILVKDFEFHSFKLLKDKVPLHIQNKMNNKIDLEEDEELSAFLTKLIKNASSTTIHDLFLNCIKNLKQWEIEEDFIKMLHISINKKVYKKIQPAIDPMLTIVFANQDDVRINPNWGELFPESISGVPPIPLKSDAEVLQDAIVHMEKLGLDPKVLDLYPHELSGGMKQRTVIAISTLWNPKLLIVDEPTSALDVSTQKKLLDLFVQLQRDKIVESILFISHDIPTLRQLCTRCIIMYGGQIVEDADMETIINNPSHPYSKSLVGSIVSFNPDGSVEAELSRIEGAPPDLREPPSGCRFHPRCKRAMDICKREVPNSYYPNGENHPVKCWLFDKKIRENQMENENDE
ncbi:Vitamin B12 import ATP-binding protein BtuD [Candidatus Lokiarchaeum ossiferum]|uniref:Vitamin B12 import ATP-binding protein BtuD n=1 Tax=Candidatus Lokiarchaeum ossiferum TaxID=2951803 RepID=A0ABY6HTW6_9ARCH|nr:Vitamin B12 import ATP-binding protein BtuD [Candidatus Lokiarchaeum sp. B-35]